MENQEINPVSPETNETSHFSMEENENQEMEPTTQPVQEEPVDEQKPEAEAEAEPETSEITEPESATDLERIMAMIGDISKKFDEKIARDSHKDQLFDKMYAELSSYKNDIYQKMLKPFIMDTIMLIDDTNKLIRDMDKTDTEKVFKVLSGIPDDLLNILERNGIEAFEDESDTFNAKTQKVLKTVPTDNPELDYKIESRIRQGYKWDEKVIKPEIIQCYKYSTN
jgi:molecular chaperone GrpE